VIVSKLEQYDYSGAAAVGVAMLLISLLALVAINIVQVAYGRRGER
jgi:sulfate transport system permease protein